LISVATYRRPGIGLVFTVRSISAQIVHGRANDEYFLTQIGGDSRVSDMTNESRRPLSVRQERVFGNRYRQYIFVYIVGYLNTGYLRFRALSMFKDPANFFG
jgi:hypothetical protein